MDSRSDPGDFPRFSVVIPTYDRADTVGRAIDSVLNQTYPASEVIIIDDGSRDATRARVEKFGPRVTYQYQDERRGSRCKEPRRQGSASSLARLPGFR